MARTIDDIIAGGGDDQVMSTLSNIANVIASIPERRARAAQQRAVMEQQQQALAIRNDELRLRQQQAAEQQAAKQRASEMDQAVNAIMQGAMVDGPNGGKILDVPRFVAGATKAGVQPERLASILGTFEKIHESVGKAEKERLGHVADLIDGALEHGADDNAITLAMAVGKANNWLRDDELAPIIEAKSAGKDVKPMLSQIRDSIRGPKEKPKPVVVPATSRLTDPETGKVLLEATAKSEHEPNVGSFEDYVTAKFGPRPTPAQITQARKEYNQADDRPRITVNTGEAADADALTQAVIDNPALWDDLTPTVKGKIAPKLAAKGYTNFGKAMSPGALTQVQASMTSLDSLKDLRQVLHDNEQYIGPIAGLQAMNPYSDARKAQAKIDLVKQRVGKALEGGVLRKEDEEKYKRILATLNDTPSTAVSKVDGLIKSVEQDIANFKAAQKLGGRRVLEPEGTPQKRIKVTFDKDGNLVRQ